MIRHQLSFLVARMNFKVGAIFVIAQLAVACSEPKEIAAGNFLPALTLISGGSDTLQLDSRTRIAGSDIHFHRKEDVDYLFLHAGFSFASIDIYNFSERRFLKRINLSKEGPNGIGSPPSGLVVKSLDTLFLFFNLGQRLISIDGSGNVLENYGSIIKYDPWQHVYYRFVIRPVSEHQYKKPTDTWNNIGIIILDEFFNYRGEFLIPDRFDWYQSFIGPKGIYFLDKSYLSKTEDKVVFTFFKVRPLHQK